MFVFVFTERETKEPQSLMGYSSNCLNSNEGGEGESFPLVIVVRVVGGGYRKYFSRAQAKEEGGKC